MSMHQVKDVRLNRKGQLNILRGKIPEVAVLADIESHSAILRVLIPMCDWAPMT